MKIFERSYRMRRVHSCSGAHAFAGRSNATQGTPSHTQLATSRSIRSHRRRLADRRADPLESIVIASFPHAPHHRRQATSHVATCVAKRHPVPQPPPMLFGEWTLPGRDGRHRCAQDHVFQDAVRVTRHTHQPRAFAAAATLEPDPYIPPQSLLTFEPKRRVHVSKERGRPNRNRSRVGE